MKLTDFKALTFDCYGTLIDWETGILAALEPLLNAGELTLERDAVLAEFARQEAAQEVATPAMLYRDLLSEVHRRLARACRTPCTWRSVLRCPDGRCSRTHRRHCSTSPATSSS